MGTSPPRGKDTGSKDTRSKDTRSKDKGVGCGGGAAGGIASGGGPGGGSAGRGGSNGLPAGIGGDAGNGGVAPPAEGDRALLVDLQDAGPGPGHWIFQQAEGPLAGYRREVVLERSGEPSGYWVTQVVELRLGVPWWSWLLVLPLRAHLGRVTSTGNGGTPWWAPPARLDRRAALVVATLAAMVAVQGFVAGVLPETLTYAAREAHTGTFGQGVVFAAVELSALPALAALVLADRRGRRGVVVWATAGAVVCTAAGAGAPTLSLLAATQVAAGAMVAAAGIAAVVVVVEEVPAGCRAWSVGVLGLAGGFGGGVPLALLPLAGLGPGGWRWLFVISLICLPFVAASARQLPESRRWQPAPVAARPRAGAAAATGAVGAAGAAAAAGAARLAERGPQTTAGSSGWKWSRRLALVCAGALLLALFATPATQFETQFLRQQRHYSPFAISLLEQLAGTLGGLGVLAGGRLADTRGRRPVAMACVAGATATALGSYLSHGWLMWLAAVASQLFFYGSVPVLGVYGAELFATPGRARSAGMVSAAAALGGVAGLLITGALGDVFSTLGPALGVVAVGPVVLVVLLALAYPESAGIALEELAAEPARAKVTIHWPENG